MPSCYDPSSKLPFISAVVAGFLFASAGAVANGAEKTLYTFQGGSDGAGPRGALIADRAGNLYGTTAAAGGVSCEFSYGCGVVFKLAPDNKETVLYAFAGGNDGATPFASLLQDSADNLYGTTGYGGGIANCGGIGCGTVFKLASDGTESVLYAFQGGTDGMGPTSGLVADTNGDFYGTTQAGGNYNGSNCEAEGCGTVFELEPNGTKITLHAFQSGSDGSGPVTGVIFDGAGNLYGTTTNGGGSGCGGAGCGTVFRITPDGTETVLYAFQGGSDGAGPFGVTMNGGGNLYGVTIQGGSCSIENKCGTVYKLASDGTKTPLYNFQGGSDGWSPESSLIMDKAGNLYGTTFYGGGKRCKRAGCGTVFKLAPGGTETVLYAFSSHGRNPAAGLLKGAHGDLYGTATTGGKDNDGAVFRVHD
jgi:uncharacterized repeat protein (TIGR03803 family)